MLYSKCFEGATEVWQLAMLLLQWMWLLNLVWWPWLLLPYSVVLWRMGGSACCALTICAVGGVADEGGVAVGTVAAVAALSVACCVQPSV